MGLKPIPLGPKLLTRYVYGSEPYQENKNHDPTSLKQPPPPMCLPRKVATQQPTELGNRQRAVVSSITGGRYEGCCSPHATKRRWQQQQASAQLDKGFSPCALPPNGQSRWSDGHVKVARQPTTNRNCKAGHLRQCPVAGGLCDGG